MSSRFARMAILIVWTWLAQTGARAQDGKSAQGTPPETDPRVRRALQEAALAFEVNAQGNAVLDFEFADQRRHRVFIRSGTQTWGGLEIREVAAYAYKGPVRPGPDMLEKLLKENARKKLGAWELWEEGGVYDVVFVARIPASADAMALGTVARGVAADADNMEKALNGGDDDL